MTVSFSLKHDATGGHPEDTVRPWGEHEGHKRMDLSAPIRDFLTDNPLERADYAS